MRYSKHIPHSACDVFSLILDVESYSLFIPKISKCIVSNKKHSSFDALLYLKSPTVSYLSNVSYVKPGYICAISKTFPLKELKAIWNIQSNSNGSCLVTLLLTIQFKIAIPVNLNFIGENMMSVFETEARRRFAEVGI